MRRHLLGKFRIGQYPRAAERVGQRFFLRRVPVQDFECLLYRPRAPVQVRAHLCAVRPRKSDFRCLRHLNCAHPLHQFQQLFPLPLHPDQLHPFHGNGCHGFTS